MDLTETIAPKSDQLNADDLLTGPRTFTIEKVSAGNPEQPVNVHLVELPGRPYRPSKSMRRVMVAAWGKEANAYAGRRLTLYRNPEITFGREKVGGIEISHVSHLPKPMTVALTAARGKKRTFTVEPLIEASHATPAQIAALVSAMNALGLETAQQKKAAIADQLGEPKSAKDLTAEEAEILTATFESLAQGVEG
jgi:hypothetical protein